jgi:uncharacterized protein
MRSPFAYNREMQVRRSRSAFLTWLSLLSLAFRVFRTSGFAERVEDLPKPTNWVSDFAHVLSPETVARAGPPLRPARATPRPMRRSKSSPQNLDGDDKDDFANRLEEKWKIGKKGSDRGILMLSPSGSQALDRSRLRP